MIIDYLLDNQQKIINYQLNGLVGYNHKLNKEQ